MEYGEGGECTQKTVVEVFNVVGAGCYLLIWPWTILTLCDNYWVELGPRSVIYKVQQVRLIPGFISQYWVPHVILSTLSMFRPGRPKGVLKCPTLVEGRIIVSFYILDNPQS